MSRVWQLFFAAVVFLAVGAATAYLATSFLREPSIDYGKALSIAVPVAASVLAVLLSLAKVSDSGKSFDRVEAAIKAEWEKTLREAQETLESSRSAPHVPSKREQLIRELRGNAELDEIRASRALWLIPIIVIGGSAIANLLDTHPTSTTQLDLVFSLVKRLGTLAVTFYLAHAAVSQYRYSTLRAAHYRACAQAVGATEDDASLLKVYRMLTPPHAFGTSPTSPLDALVKIAGGKGDDK